MKRESQSPTQNSKLITQNYSVLSPQHSLRHGSAHDAEVGLHQRLILRADKLEGCTEGSQEVTELRVIADTVGAYEAKRWPNGAAPGGKRE